MQYEFSNKTKNLKSSAIREILKYANDPNIISFSAGSPSPDTFPVEKISNIVNEIFKEEPTCALQYNITEGYIPLRNTLKKYLEDKYPITKEYDELIITSGAQQVIDISSKILCNEGDTIICESPSFIGALNTFRSYNVNICGIPMQSDGIDLEKLEKALKTHINVKFIYTIPNFQNPSGITMSYSKRKILYELAKEHNVLILEDNPYGDLRYAGKDIPSIKSLDKDGIVIYAGTFSKILSPGLRVGYAIAPKKLIQKIVVCKQVQDVHSNILAQMIVYRFIKKYNLDNHIKEINNLYKKKLKLTINLLDKYTKGHIKYNKPHGGLFIWCTLPESIDMIEYCKQAALKKVCIVPGNIFLTNEREISHSFRMNFSTSTDKDISTGIQILSSLINKF